MTRDDLLDRLRELTPPTCASVFVNLWGYLSFVDLGQAENHLRDRGLFPLQLEPGRAFRDPRPARLTASVERLARMRGRPGKFDAYCAEWIAGQDHALASADALRFAGTFSVRDRGEYLLRRRADYLARLWGSSHPKKAEQGRNLATYARRHLCVPLAVDGTPELAVRTSDDWAEQSVHARLLAERDSFCAVLWPMSTGPDYDAVHALQPGTNQVHLDTVRNDEAVAEEMQLAVSRAQAEKATLLLLPELVLTERAEDALRAAIGAAEGPYPVLTLAGRNHRRRGDGGPFENRAVLLNSAGEQLHEHTKTTCFVDYKYGDGMVVGEGTECGATITVLESDLGNLVPLICLDLLQEPTLGRVRNSHGSVVLVPSLSPKTSAHRDAGRSLATSSRALTLVVNRWLQSDDSGRASSLVVSPDASTVHHIPEGGAPDDPTCLVLRPPG